MVNKALRIVLYSIFTISLLFVVPFNNIYAEYVSGDSPIIGVNIKYRDYDIDHEPYQLSASLEMPHRWQCVSSHSTMGCQAWSSQDTSGTIQDEITGTINVTSGSWTDKLYEYEFILDKSYVGHINLSTAIGPTAFNQYFVNGTSFTLTSTQLFTSFTVSSYQLEYAPLEVIDVMKFWNIPNESVPIVASFLNSNKQLYEIRQFNNINYPVFKIGLNEEICKISVLLDVAYFIFISNPEFSAYSIQYDLTYTSSTGVTPVVQYEEIGTWTENWKASKIIINTNNQNCGVVTITCNRNNQLIIPIFSGRKTSLKVSTDFALIYGLSNQLLDDLHLIANGTNASSAASSQSDQANSQLQQDSNTLFSQEDSFKQNMNSAMQNIDITFTLNNFGQSFMTSAQWVRTQYETLTNNTPFASLITFSLLVGLALILVGKVYK